MSTRACPAKPVSMAATRRRRTLRTAGRDHERVVADQFDWRPNELIVGVPRASRKAREPGNA
jgi:hypothetical protein